MRPNKRPDTMTDGPLQDIVDLPFAARELHELMRELADPAGLCWRDTLIAHPLIQAKTPDETDKLLNMLKVNAFVATFHVAGDSKRVAYLMLTMMIDLFGNEATQENFDKINTRFRQGYLYRLLGPEEYMAKMAREA